MTEDYSPSMGEGNTTNAKPTNQICTVDGGLYTIKERDLAQRLDKACVCVCPSEADELVPIGRHSGPFMRDGVMLGLTGYR